MAIHHDTSLSNLLGEIFTTTAEKATALVSVSMITTPLWLQYVQPVSQIAAVFAPILGCIYLLLQIGFKLWNGKGD